MLSVESVGDLKKMEKSYQLNIIELAGASRRFSNKFLGSWWLVFGSYLSTIIPCRILGISQI